MLSYFQNSNSKNAVDDATRKIDSYVTKVKHLPEVEAGYMTLGDWIDAIVDEAKEDMRDELRAEVAEEISEEVTEKVSKEVTEKVSKEVTEKVSKEVTEKSIEILVEMFQEYNDTKENAVIKLQTKYPDFADQAVEFVEKYWK
jgi:predicted ATPase with chaperone activity